MLSGDGTQTATTLRNNTIGDTYVAEQVAALIAAAENLREHDTSTLTNADRRALMQAAEYTGRVLTGSSHTWLNQLIEQHGFDLYPGSVPYSLAAMLVISGPKACERVRLAQRLGTTTTPTGEKIDPVLPATAAAQRDGAISAQHVSIIDRFHKSLSSSVDPETKAAAEQQLGLLARELPPEELKAAARKLEAWIDQDGPEPKDPKDKARRRSFWMSEQDKDGWVTGGFVTDAEGAELLQLLLDCWAKPGQCNPDDTTDNTTDDSDDADSDDTDSDDTDSDDTDSEDTDSTKPESESEEPVSATVRDPRTVKQRQHDAFMEAMRRVVRSGMLGTKNGLDAVAIVTLTLKDLEAGSGLAVTAAGTHLSVQDAIRLTAHTRPYLLVLDDRDRPLYLGRSKRLASTFQRMALVATERGCSFPGCTRPATWSQVHHIDEWEHGGNTDIDRLTFACEAHHPLVGSGENHWATTTAPPGHKYAGRTLWHPPAALDPTRTGRVNHFHTPAEYLMHHPPEPQDKAS